MKYIKFTLALITFLSIHTVLLTAEWLKLVFMSLYLAVIDWPMPILVFTITMNILLLQLTFFQWVFCLSYLVLWLVFLLVPKYREWTRRSIADRRKSCS